MILTLNLYIDNINIRGVVIVPKKHNFFKLEMLILSTLEDSDRYGYEIASMIREYTMSLFDLKVGVMYPILYNLETDGFVSKYSKQVEGRTRVYYHLEKIGHYYLKDLFIEFNESIVAINKLLLRKERKGD